MMIFLLTVGLVNLLFALLVGNLWETRIFYPLIPCLILSSSIILEKRKGKTVLLSFLVIMVVSLFFIGNGLHLREDSEFAAKIVVISSIFSTISLTVVVGLT